MSVTAKDFLDLAKSMIQSKPSEIEKRCAVSRAYYAAYHLAQEKFPPSAADQNSEADKAGVHQRYITNLKQFPDKSTERFIGLKLDKLRGRRVIADYRLDEVLTIDFLPAQMSHANTVFDKLTNPAGATNAVTSATSSAQAPQPQPQSAAPRKEETQPSTSTRPRPKIQLINSKKIAAIHQPIQKNKSEDDSADK